MDDICRNFLIQTRDAIQQLEKDLRSAEKELRITRATVSSIAERHPKLEELRKSAALIKRETLSVAKQIDKEQLGEQLALRVHLFTTKVYEVKLRDYFAAANNFMDLSSCESPATWPKSVSLPSLEGSLDECRDLIKRAADTGHLRVVIAATLSFAKIERLLYFFKSIGVGQNHDEDSFEAIVAEDYTESSLELLHTALFLCSKLSNNKKLKKRVKQAMALLDPRNGTMTPHELASLKSSLDSRSSGLGTTTGRWCYCINGHAVSCN